MSKRRFIQLLAALAVSTGVAACATHNAEVAASGGEIEAEIARSVVVHVSNMNSVPVEIQAGVTGGSARFMGVVGPNETADVLLDSQWFPTAMLYLIAVPADGKAKSVAGPLSATRGQQINFTVERDARSSHAFTAPATRRPPAKAQ